MVPDGLQGGFEEPKKSKKVKMSNVPECCVSNCNNVEDEENNLRLFPVPERPDPRWQAWLYACNRVDVIKESAFLINTSQKYFVCSYHFENRMFHQDKDGEISLVTNAEPTIFKPFFRKNSFTAKDERDEEDYEMTEELGVIGKEGQQTNCLGLLQAICNKFKRQEEYADRRSSEINTPKVQSLMSPLGLSNDSTEAIPSDEVFGSLDSFYGLTDETQVSRPGDVADKSESVNGPSSNADCNKFVPKNRVVKNHISLAGCVTYIFKEKDKMEDGSYPTVPFLMAHESEEERSEDSDEEEVPEISYRLDGNSFDFATGPKNKICRMWM